MKSRETAEQRHRRLDPHCSCSSCCDYDEARWQLRKNADRLVADLAYLARGFARFMPTGESAWWVAKIQATGDALRTVRKAMELGGVR